MNAAADHRACAGTTLVTLLAIAAFCCVVANPAADGAAGANTAAALQSGDATAPTARART